jgi:hypothetical protein
MRTDWQGNLETSVAPAETLGAATIADRPVQGTNPVQSTGVCDEKASERSAQQTEAARTRAAQFIFMAERRFVEAKQALEEAGSSMRSRHVPSFVPMPR